MTDQELIMAAARNLWEIDESLDDRYRNFDQETHDRLGELVKCESSLS